MSNWIHVKTEKPHNRQIFEWISILMFFFISLPNVFAAGKEIAWDTILYQSKGIVVRPPATSNHSLKTWCDIGNKNQFWIYAFYDVPNEQRQKRLGASYEAFIQNSIAPVIKKICNLAVYKISMSMKQKHYITPNSVRASWLSNRNDPIWDRMTFKISKSGVIRSGYYPRAAKKNWTEAQINLLKPTKIVLDRLEQALFTDELIGVYPAGPNWCYGNRSQYPYDSKPKPSYLDVVYDMSDEQQAIWIKEDYPNFLSSVIQPLVEKNCGSKFFDISFYRKGQTEITESFKYALKPSITGQHTENLELLNHSSLAIETAKSERTNAKVLGIKKTVTHTPMGTKLLLTTLGEFKKNNMLRRNTCKVLPPELNNKINGVVDKLNLSDDEYLKLVGDVPSFGVRGIQNIYHRKQKKVVYFTNYFNETQVMMVKQRGSSEIDSFPILCGTVASLAETKLNQIKKIWGEECTGEFCSLSGGRYLNAIYNNDIALIRSFDKRINSKNRKSFPQTKVNSVLSYLAIDYMFDFPCLTKDAVTITSRYTTASYDTVDLNGVYSGPGGGDTTWAKYTINPEFSSLCNRVCNHAGGEPIHNLHLRLMRGSYKALAYTLNGLDDFRTNLKPRDCKSPKLKKFERNLISLTNKFLDNRVTWLDINDKN